jgi:S1-C subfamily serine protease
MAPECIRRIVIADICEGEPSMATNGVLASLSDDLAGAVEKAGRSVLTVHGRRRMPASGIVWPGGVVVTADHVLERDEDLSVSTPAGDELKVALVGRDPGSDVAVLRPSGGSLDPAGVAAEGSTKVGHIVLALGRPGPSGVMASFGVVSALGGPWRTARGGRVEGYIRADVALYPGFSDGPLINTAGEVVGLISSHLARGQEVALPAAHLEAIVKSLLTGGKVKRAYLGIGSQPVQLPEAVRRKLGLEQEVALMVLWVEPGSPADQGGLFMGDVLVSLAGRSVAGVEDLQTALGPSTVGKPLQAAVLRGGERREVTITPGERG